MLLETSEEKGSDTLDMNILSLPSEVLGLVFSKLDDKKRYQIIPLVNSRFRQIHVANPPIHRHYIIEIDLSKPVTRSLIDYIVAIAPSLEIWELTCCQTAPGSAGLIPHLMTKAAMFASKLRSLEVYVESTQFIQDLAASIRPIVDGVVLFTQLKSLVIEPWVFSAVGDVIQVQGLTNLRRLESLSITFASSTWITAEQADALWAALSALKHLGDLGISFTSPFKPKTVLPFFLNSLLLLTQISDLVLTDVGICLNEGGRLPESFSSLTQLTDLLIGDQESQLYLSSAALQPISGLPKLKTLTIGIEDGDSEDAQTAGLVLSSTALTHLAIVSGIKSSYMLAELLPPTAPSLRSLRELELPCNQLEDFPAQLASSLKAVTKLCLWHNKLPLMPSSLSHLTALQHLDLGQNRTLQLRHSDLNTIQAMSHLKMLGLRSFPVPTFSGESTWTLMAISRRFPDLELPGP